MKFTVYTIFITIIVGAYSQKCSTENFKITWQRSNVDTHKHEYIFNGSFDEAKVVKIAPNQTVTKICANTLKNVPNAGFFLFNDSGIEEIESGSFKNSPNLSHIDLRRNNLERISNGVFTGLSVRILQFGQNRIREIEDGAFDNMQNLLILDLKNNNIEVIPVNWFKSTTKIAQLNLEGNSIQALPANVFKNMRQSGVNTPLSIYLENNKIEFIDEAAFDGLEKLNKLTLHKNKITILNGNVFSKISHINGMTLHRNKMECINNSLQFLKKVTAITLAQNSWDCTCLENIQNFYSENDMQDPNVDSLDCY